MTSPPQIFSHARRNAKQSPMPATPSRNIAGSQTTRFIATLPTGHASAQIVSALPARARAMTMGLSSNASTKLRSHEACQATLRRGSRAMTEGVAVTGRARFRWAPPRDAGAGSTCRDTKQAATLTTCWRSSVASIVEHACFTRARCRCCPRNARSARDARRKRVGAARRPRLAGADAPGTGPSRSAIAMAGLDQLASCALPL